MSPVFPIGTEESLSGDILPGSFTPTCRFPAHRFPRFSRARLCFKKELKNKLFLQETLSPKTPLPVKST